MNITRALPFLFISFSSSAITEDELYAQAFGKKIDKSVTQDLDVNLIFSNKYQFKTKIKLDYKSEFLDFNTKQINDVLKTIVKRELLQKLNLLSKIKFKNIKEKLKAYEDLGIIIRYHPLKLLLTVNIRADKNAPKTIYISRDFSHISNIGADMPSNFSMFNNISFSNDSSILQQTSDNIKNSTNVNLNTGINYKNFVLLNNFSYNSINDIFRRNRTTLLKEFKDNSIRISFGDIISDSVGFQSVSRLIGLKLERKAGINPFLPFYPTGESKFFLKRKSHVEIYINDIKIRTLILEPGNYDLQNIPLFSGRSNIILKLIDDLGNIYYINKSTFSNATLVKEGEYEFSSSYGYPKNLNFLSDSSYNYNNHIYSGYLRYGLSNRLNLTASYQESFNTSQYGVILDNSNFLGNFSLSSFSSENYQTRKIGSAYNFEYSSNKLNYKIGNFHPISKGSLGFKIKYKSKYFSGAVDNTKNFNSLSLKLGFSNYFYHDYSYNFYYNYSQKNLTANTIMNPINQSDDLSYSYGLKVGGKIPKTGFTLNFDYATKKSFNSPKDSWEIGLNLIWYPSDGGHNFSFTSKFKEEGTHYESIDYSNSLEQSSSTKKTIKGSLKNNDKITSIGLQYQHNNQYYDLSLAGEYRGAKKGDNWSEYDAHFRLGTSLVYAGGLWGISRPIHDNFTIIDIKNYPSQEGDVYINKSYGGGYEAKITPYLAAVVDGPSKYRTKKIDIEVSELPQGISFDNYSFLSYGSTYSGTPIVINAKKTIYIGGTLYMGDEVASLLGGKFINVETKEEFMFFTNKYGLFRVDNLEPGEYIIKVFGKTTSITVPDVNKKYYNLGDVIIKK